MLPSIRISLPLLMILWCGVSIWAFESPVMLLYPAMWVGVALLFLLVTKLLGPGNAPSDVS